MAAFLVVRSTFLSRQIDYYVTYSRPLYTGLLQPPSPLNGGFTDRGNVEYYFSNEILRIEK